jgi:hypothetical protein
LTSSLAVFAMLPHLAKIWRIIYLNLLVTGYQILT